MEQTRALNALAPFVALAKSANSPRAAADLITQATSVQNTYVFAELLQQPNIQALAANEQFGAHYKLLEIFAWGTWEAYQGTVEDHQYINLSAELLHSYYWPASTVRRAGGQASPPKSSHHSVPEERLVAFRNQPQLRIIVYPTLPYQTG